MPLPWKRNKPPEPSREDSTRSSTQKIAYELYQTRQLLNRSGDTHTDWAIAERILQSRLRLALYRCHRPFIRLEKNTWEPLLAWANNQALLSLLGLVGNIGLIIAVTTYIASEKHRRNSEVLNAWQTITNANEQAGSAGRIQALEFLNASPGANWRRKFPWVCAPWSVCLWPSESLNGINLSVQDDVYVGEASRRASFPPIGLDTASRGVYLREIQLPKASLSFAKLKEAYLVSANLERTEFGHADMEGADLRFANLKEADLRFANLERGELGHADMEGADLSSANLKRANLSGANLEGAYLNKANLERADLSHVNLEGAYLNKANLERADLSHVNLEGVNLTTKQLSQAKLCNTQLPADINLSSDRDCEELESNEP